MTNAMTNTDEHCPMTNCEHSALRIEHWHKVRSEGVTVIQL
jgi:hypothetical protein